MNWPGDFSFAGSKFTYNRLYSGLETVYSPGPTNESLEVQVRVMPFKLNLLFFIYFQELSFTLLNDSKNKSKVFSQRSTCLQEKG